MEMTREPYSSDDMPRETMKRTLDYDHGEKLIVNAEVIKRPVEGVPGEFEYFYSMMMDIPSNATSSSSCVMAGSPVYDQYDECVIAMNDRLKKWVDERYDV